ncbi:TPA: CapA family protein [Vibrio alginolyticus]|uniref:CapA family protein n=1 Tax=Vibrio alginolyticus TaxID=663 RepID=UPI00215E2BBE|nr:CapA family protein [Vibrio alginolyticus]MCS0180896.1 CapA family protein [Vibrio alginolyticus]
MKICFGGDVFLGGDLESSHQSELIQSSTFRNASLRVINFEQAVSDNVFVADKCTLYTKSDSLKHLKDMRVNAVNLAHNHIQDKGLEGISETVEHLDEVGIDSFGAGGDLFRAREKVYLSESLVIFGYCDFDKTYLNQIEIAGYQKAGVNPLRLESILKDLNNLKFGEKAVLYFHWGQEHLWLPRHEDIELVKTLLDDSRVATVIGMHCHRVQGIIKHNNKKAYMSLGNLLFPNFYISTPTQLTYPSEKEKKLVKYQTRLYHNVYEMTYKKWKLVNRISMLVEYDTEKECSVFSFVVQDDHIPIVRDASKPIRFFMTIWVHLLNMLYKLPKKPYVFLQKTNAILTKVSWKIMINIFHSKQIGIRKSWSSDLNKIIKKVRNFVKK